MPSLRERLTGFLNPPTPKPPATIAGSAERERAAEGMDLDALCRTMRPRALAFARAYLRRGTARAAAIDAGYPESSAHKAAHRLLRDPFVRRYVGLARVEAAVAERADLAALRAQLWDIATGRCSRGAPSRDCPCVGCSATAKERETARTNLVRILLALERGGGGWSTVPKPAPGAGAPAGGGDGWTREARADFERSVLGVELDDPEIRTESADPDAVRKSGRSGGWRVTGQVLLPYQARWYALGRGGASRWRVAEKSRQIGLTWTEAARQAAVAATSRAAGGRDCLYVSTSLLLAREYIDTVALWARAMHGAAERVGLTVLRDGANDILAHEVRFASGFTVTGVPSNPAAFRGRRGEVCLDEFAHHLHAAELLKAAFALTQWGGAVSVISTHNGARNEFVRVIDRVKRGEATGGHLRVTIDDAIADGLYRRICKIEGRPWSAEGEARFRADCMASPGAAEEFGCEPADAGSVFYRRDLLERCAKPGQVLHLARPKDWITKPQAEREAATRAWCENVLKPILTSDAHTRRDRVHYLGLDYGRTVDLSVIWCLEQLQDLSQVTPWIVELRNVPAAEQEIVADYILGKLPRCAGAAVDVSEGGGHTLAEGLAGRWGRREPGEDGPGLIVGVKLAPAWYDREHYQLRMRLEERDLFVVRDEDVLDDLGSWRVNEKGDVRLGDRTVSRRDKGQRHGDAGVALLLAQSLAPEVPQVGKHLGLRPAVPKRGARP